MPNNEETNTNIDYEAETVEIETAHPEEDVRVSRGILVGLGALALIPAGYYGGKRAVKKAKAHLELRRQAKEEETELATELQDKIKSIKK